MAVVVQNMGGGGVIYIKGPYQTELPTQTQVKFHVVYLSKCPTALIYVTLDQNDSQFWDENAHCDYDKENRIARSLSVLERIIIS